MICLLAMTDGRRECVARAIPSAEHNLHGDITRRIIHDDSGDPAFRSWLADLFPHFEIIGGPHRRGFGGAYRNAWHHLAVEATEPYVFATEDDFLFDRPVALHEMAAVLDRHPELAQLALLRQAWNEPERAAGGIIQQHPDAYTYRTAPAGGRGARWVEHRLFFTTNPSLYRRSLCAIGWPDGAHSEGGLTHRLLTDPGLRFGFWGGGEEWVTHIGRERAGVGY